MPDPLLNRSFRLDSDVAAEITEAETAIARLNLESTALVDTEALARLLLRAESVASSRIEGLEVGARRLLRAEVAQDLAQSNDVTANEVLANIDAMVWALQAAPDGEISVGQLLEIHRRLSTGTHLATHGGQIRDVQNWIGGSNSNPCSAAFVPPPPELVPELLLDLCSFCNLDSLPATAQAAIAHAQFETIHPFIDGNGRTGRALIHLVLRRRGLAPRILPPVSLILATRAQDYVRGLTGTRYIGPAGTAAAHDGVNEWIALFAAACKRAVDDATSFEARVSQLQDAWRARLGRVRHDSATDLLIRSLPGAPIVTVNSASGLIGRSFQATNGAIERLSEARVLNQVKLGQRNRAFEASELVDAFIDFERQLASRAGDTRALAPARSVPPRLPASK